METSIGQVNLKSHADRDHDEAADEAERDFEEMSQVQPSADQMPPSVSAGKKKSTDPEDERLESATSRAPGASN